MLVRSLIAAAVACAVSLPGNLSHGEEYLNGILWQAPPVVTPGETDADPPSDATVLFDGTDLSKWNNGENWPVKEGIAFSGKGPIVSKESLAIARCTSNGRRPCQPREAARDVATAASS